MAVYTHLGAEQLAELIGEFDVGQLVSAKGIAEGVSNSNWLIDTTGADGAGARFILTMYEFRIEIEDLPFFLSLLDYLADQGCPVPRTIHDRQGRLFRLLGDKAIALIEFLPGVSVSEPTPGQAHAVGRALAQLHLTSAGFGQSRANGMGTAEWQRLAQECTPEGLAAIDPDFAAQVARELPQLVAEWPEHLPHSVIHADLFPDNVFFAEDRVTGIIDFYFACNDLLAYDVAICLNAWCFEPDGSFNVTKARLMLASYRATRPLSREEIAVLPLFARGSALRFALTRLYDWLNHPPGAFVTPKDPKEYLRKMRFHAGVAGPSAYGIDP